MEHEAIKKKAYQHYNGHDHVAPADIVTFESAEDMHEYIKNAPSGETARQQIEHGFNLHKWDAVLDMLRTGYSEGAAELDATLETLTRGIGEQDRDVWNMDVTGDYVDVGEYMTGSPECFMKQETIKEFGSLVKVKVNTFYESRVTTASILNRGAVVMALVDAIAKTNPVELEIIAVCLNASQDTPNHTLDIRYRTTMEGGYSRDLVAFMLTHPDYFRRCEFAVYELMYPGKVGWAYGCPGDLTKEEQDDCVYFPSTIKGSDYGTMGKAIEKFKELLAPYVSDTAALS